MIKKILRNTGLYVYLKYWRKKYFPSQIQRNENGLLGEKLVFYKQFLKWGDLCFDVGANIGNRTEAFLNLGAKVVAVEPQSECAQMLRLRFGGKIKLIKMALGERETDGSIYISDTSEISSLSKDWIDSVSKSRFKDSQWNKKETVKITTLDNLIASNGLPKFCKIDVEGYEEEVLKGLSQPIDFISFEYTIPERLKNFSNCLAQLSRIGKFDCNYTVGEKMKLEFRTWVSKDELVKKVNEISNESLFGDIYIRFKIDK
jgi:FkbM family methyltransferase